VILSLQSEALDQVMKDPVVTELVPGEDGEAMSFDDFTRQIEEQLDELVNLERELDLQKQNKFHQI
jgi:hypothetical protein